jgi:hypothetical protein
MHMTKIKWGFVTAAMAAMTASAWADSVGSQGTWSSTLQARDLDGNASTIEAYFDTALQVTWLADANFAGTTEYVGANGQTSGELSWYGATGLASGELYGLGGWRLPRVQDTGTLGCTSGEPDCGAHVDPSVSELAHMYGVTLGNAPSCSDVGCLIDPHPNAGPFNNLQGAGYWTGNSHLTKPYIDWSDTAWYFNMGAGEQSFDPKANSNYVWVLHDGDIGSPVPESSTLTMLSLGLFAIGVGVQRQRKQ